MISFELLSSCCLKYLELLSRYYFDLRGTGRQVIMHNFEGTLSGRKRNIVLLALVLLAADQLSKLAAYVLLRGKNGTILLPHVLELQYLENEGAAFGILRGRQWIFVLFAALIMLLVIWFCRRIPDRKEFRPLLYLAAILSAGALGNMADRILHTYVIDFIYLSFIDFPVFNIADMYVVGSCIGFLYLILFRYKDEDLKQILK